MQLLKVNIACFLGLLTALSVVGQPVYSSNRKSRKGKAAIQQADSAKKEDSHAVKPFAKVITSNMKVQNGLINVYQKKDHYYFEVPFRLLKREILIVNRISRAASDMRTGYQGLAGDNIGEGVYRFRRGPLNKLFLERLSFTEYENDSTRPMYNSVQQNNVPALVQVFAIEAYNRDSTGMVIDATKLLNSDNHVLYFKDEAAKKAEGIGAQESDRSYVKFVHAYKTNIEICAFKTYRAADNKKSPVYSLELNSSLVLLPQKPMRPRLADPRVGYFTISHRNFDINPQGVKTLRIAKRWRLEPKPEDRGKYLRGELVEPQKPIVFYIDPATPSKWVPYLIEGVDDWQKAFEKAGFKHAIYARVAPTHQEDSTWSMDNANYSAIIYRPSEVENAMGPSISDPRSGEIMESHIFWYHNVMKLLRNWYMIQCGAVDTAAQKPVFSDQLMGQLIRFVSSHEVGHTLGLMHNFGSSSTVPVEKLRDKKWVEAHGHTPSIMDYARFNYVAQPQDSIGHKGLFPRIGDYDKWAIYWGYRWYPDFKDQFAEQKFLIKMVTDSLEANHRLWYGAQGELVDPRSQNEDLGNDAMLAGKYGIANLKRIAPDLVDWTTSPTSDYSVLTDVFRMLIGQYRMYLIHVTKNIGGINHDAKVAGMKGPVYSPTPYNKQKRAVRFLDQELFRTPKWLDQQEIYDKIPETFGTDLAELQKGIINQLISPLKLCQLLTIEYDYPTTKVYSLSHFLDDLDQEIFTELYHRNPVSFYRRNLQQIYVTRLIDELAAVDDSRQKVWGLFGVGKYDYKGALLNQLEKEQKLIDRNLKKSSLDEATRIHLNELAHWIQKALNLNS